MLDIAPDVRIVCWRCPQLWQGQPLGQSKPAGLIFLYAVLQLTELFTIRRNRPNRGL